ncbi:MAG: MGMT family protein [Verrucomicrobia bacterium]|nr:MGMT family protein [Verrucomicrobiota bacterium]
MHTTHFIEKKGPPVRIHCYVDNQRLVNTVLEYAPVFEAYIEADPISASTAETLLNWLYQFSRKKKSSPFPIELLALDQVSPFRKEVFATLCKIPFGQVASYGEVAQKIGNEKASRAVGSACGRNPFPLIVPCHRVIAGDGSAGGFSLDFRIKRDLLAFEASASTKTHTQTT